MGNKCCSSHSCDLINNEDYGSSVVRKGGKPIRQSYKVPKRNIEGMKRQIDENITVERRSTNMSRQTNTSSHQVRVVDFNEDRTMSFLKGAEREPFNTMDFS